MKRNPYEVLGVSSTDTKEFIKAKYRSLCKIYHPDVIGTGDVSKFREIQEAWDLINSSVSNSEISYWSHKTIFSVERRSYNEKGH